MRLAGTYVLVMLAFAQIASAQVTEPPSRCVQNCGGASTPVSPGPTASDKRDAARKRARQTELALDEGIVYYDRKDWNNAIRSFEEALEHSPEDRYIEKWLVSARSQKAAKDAGPVMKDGKIKPRPAVIPPPLRRGQTPGRVGPPGDVEITVGGAKG